MEERIELRGAGGPLLGVLLLHPLRLEVKRGRRLFEVDLLETLRTQDAVVLKRVLRVEVNEVQRQETQARANLPIKAGDSPG